MEGFLLVWGHALKLLGAIAVIVVGVFLFLLGHVVESLPLYVFGFLLAGGGGTLLYRIGYRK